MRWGATVLTVALLIALVWMSGCSTTSFGNQQAGNFGGSSAGNFGSTADQQAAIQWFITTYGDPRGSGTPAFIEPMVSTNVVDNMPVDKVTAFSKATDKIFFWVFYEHFTTGDTITMNMVYTTNGQTVLDSSQKAGGEYGAATGSVSPPSGGWPTGDYLITFSGKGATKTVAFKVIDGPTATVPLPYTSGQPKNVGNVPAVVTSSGTSTTSEAIVQSINVYVFPDGNAVANFSYNPENGVQDPQQEMKAIATGIFGSVFGPVYPVTRMSGPFSQSISNIEDTRQSAPAVITIPVDTRESSVTGAAYVTFGIPQFASVMTNVTGTLYTTPGLVFPRNISFTLRYFDTAWAHEPNSDVFPGTTHFMQQLSNGSYLVYPISTRGTSSVTRLGEPVPGAEIYIELEPDDESDIRLNPNAIGEGGPTVHQTAQASIQPIKTATLVAVPITTPTTSATTCTPGINTNIVIYQVDSTGQGTQIAQTTTDTNGVFSFSVSASQKSASSITYSFGFSPDKTVGFIKEDGISTYDIHMAKSTNGPVYTYTFCSTGPIFSDRTQSGRWLIVSGERADISE
jgi:hypothetical protein